MDAEPRNARAPVEQAPMPPVNDFGPGPDLRSDARDMREFEDLEAAPDAPVALPVALAAGGALIGAALWAGIAYATGFEIGYVAWAIGGLVGGGMVLGGGRGVAHAGIAAALALVGIFAGKYYGTSMLIEHQLKQLDAMFDRSAFEQMREMAMDAPAMPGGELAVEYVDDTEPGDATAEELQQLAEAEYRAMELLRDPNYTFEHWRDDRRREMRSMIKPMDLMLEGFGFLDVVFILLGLTTAFSVVQRASARAQGFAS